MKGKHLLASAVLFAVVWYGFRVDIYEGDEMLVVVENAKRKNGHHRRTRRTAKSPYYASTLRTDIDCFTGDGSGYIGTKAVTISGHKCQPWAVQEPNNHMYNAGELGPEFDLKKNYCRNPDVGESEPWCYNGENDSPRFEACGVPRCASPTLKYRSFRGIVKMTADLRLEPFHHMPLSQAKALCSRTNWCTAFTFWTATNRPTYTSGWLLGNSIRLNTHSAYSNWQVYVTQKAKIYPSLGIFSDSNSDSSYSLEEEAPSPSKYQPRIADIEAMIARFGAMPLPKDEEQYVEYIHTFNAIAEIVGASTDRLQTYAEERAFKELHRCSKCTNIIDSVQLQLLIFSIVLACVSPFQVRLASFSPLYSRMHS